MAKAKNTATGQRAPARKPAAAPARAAATRPATPAPRTQAAARATQLAQAPQQEQQQQGLDAWEQAKLNARKPRTGTTVPVRKQPYTAVLTGASLFATSKGEKIKWTGTVVEDQEHEGCKVERWSAPIDTDDPQQLEYLMRDFLVLGADVDQMTRADITQEALDEMVADRPAFECSVAQNGEYTNVYFNKPVEINDQGPIGIETTAPAEEPEEVPEDIEEQIDVGSAVEYTGVGGVARSGSVERFEADGAKTIIRDDETNKLVKVSSDKVTLVATAAE